MGKDEERMGRGGEVWVIEERERKARGGWKRERRRWRDG